MGELKEFERLNHKLFEADTKLIDSISSTLFPFSETIQFSNMESSTPLQLKSHFSKYKVTVIVLSFIKFSAVCKFFDQRNFVLVYIFV